MSERVLSPLGVEMTGIDLDTADDDFVAHLGALLADCGVTVVRDQTLDDAAFVRFLRRFGDLVFTVGETPVAGFPDLNVISNVGRTTPPRSNFHVDTSYVSRPPAYTALRAVTIPEQGGATLFSNQYRALATLPPALREQVGQRTIRHVVTGVDPGAGQEHEAEHPVVRPHPVSGREALYLTSPARCAAVSGLDAAAAEHLVAALYAHSTADDNVYRHHWRAGDVVMWDNAAVLHKADHSGVVGDRVMHRGMVDGYAVERGMVDGYAQQERPA